ncbi:AMP-binding protein [Acidiferrimicrobium sp. IK]|uniref:AMP-binding protein n=1 Tax=Acidiferrimicrobium sp. IK TaxID=2871700 RepID=UPI0021CB3757|nr:AMP-binding protein [Acidiferrimicrobium sp. IK]MCU4183451.1 AMP-binding protein [Acidiferrimicrobium sp. IK]
METAAALHGDADAYVEGDAHLSFRGWAAAADAVAAEMVDRGVRPGDVVALHLPPSIDYAVAVAATLRAGAVATGINTRLGPREIAGILEQCRPALVVREGPSSSAKSGVEGAAPAPFTSGSAPSMWRSELDAARQRPGLGSAAPVRRPDDPAVIIWTSGTTAMPKGAWFDHRNLEAAVHSAGVMSAPYDRRLVGTPFAHAGYMAKLWEQLAWGTAMVISPTPWRAGDMLRLLLEEKITVAGGVPTQWAKLLEEPGLERLALSRLRVALVATAPATPDLVRRVEAVLGCPMIVRYAMTESPSITGTEPGDHPEVLQRTVGRPQAGMEVTVVGDGGEVLPVGTTGRVRVRGASVMRGYWAAPALTARVLAPDGWLTTGDLGSIGTDGNLALAGRADDLYIRGGYNVYPTEVEAVLSEHGGIASVAVVGAEAPVIGQIGVAFVVPSEPDDPPTPAELRAWVGARLADYKAPDEVRIVDELPLTPMAKVDRRALRTLAAAQRLPRGAAGPSAARPAPRLSNIAVMSSDGPAAGDQAAQLRIEPLDGTSAVTVVTLDRPKRRNTIDGDSAARLTQWLEELNTDRSVRAVVITGSGRDYCTGADVAAAGPQPSPLDYRYATEPFRRLFKALWEVEKPVVSAVNGTVAGAGWMLALLGDLVVADRTARWTHVFSRRGMVPHAGDPYFLPRIIPFHRLNELALLSDPVTSAQLAEWGVINRLVDAEEVLPVALDLARRLAEGPTRALGLTKRLYRRSLSSDMATSFDEERSATALLSTTADRREGMQSFVEGRPPRFIGD